MHSEQTGNVTIKHAVHVTYYLQNFAFFTSCLILPLMCFNYIQFN